MKREQHAVSVSGEVTPALPLALLEAVRAHDRPGELLEDEDLTVSLPRRLGLTGVVETQIQRYETAARAGRPVPQDEFLNLTRLVLKRPDAAAILVDTGRRMAERHFRRVPAAYVKLLRALPRTALFAAWRRSARRMLSRMIGTAELDLSSRPLAIKLTNSEICELDPQGVACGLYTGAIEQLLSFYTAQPARFTHPQCVGDGRKSCEWRLS